MSNENNQLSLDQLEAVSGGAVPPAIHTVNVTCGNCEDRGPHRMDSGWSAICRKCGETINLKAMGGE